MTADLDIQLKAILDEYPLEVQKDVEESAKKSAQKGASELRKTSPKDTGKYAKGWSYKKQGAGLGQTSYVIYNNARPGMTHILENGHLIRNQYGTYGRTAPRPHIKPVEVLVSQYFIEELTKNLSK